MWYLPFLRMKRFLSIFTLSLVGLSILNLVIRYWPGAVHASAHNLDNWSHIHIDGWIFVPVCAAIVAAIATVLGLHLSAENDGHLEFAWTQPISRDGAALSIFGVDIIGLVLAQLIMMVLLTVTTDLWFGQPAVVFDGSVNGAVQQRADQTGEARPIFNESTMHDTLAVTIAKSALIMTFPLSIYAWIAVLSASLKRNRGTVAALFWPVILGISAWQFIPVKAFATIAGALAYINPLRLYTDSSSAPASIPNLAFGFLLAAVMLGLALVQWRRLEA